jgi:hypothetical protein
VNPRLGAGAGAGFGASKGAGAACSIRGAGAASGDAGLTGAGGTGTLGSGGMATGGGTGTGCVGAGGASTTRNGRPSPSRIPGMPNCSANSSACTNSDTSKPPASRRLAGASFDGARGAAAGIAMSVDMQIG